MKSDRSSFELHPISGLAIAVAAITIAAIGGSFIWSFSVSLALLVFGVVTKHWTLLKNAARIFPLLLVFILLVRTLFLGNSESGILFELGPLHATKNGLMDGLNAGALILAVGLAVMTFFTMVPIKMLVGVLEQAGASPKATYVVLSTLQMIPELQSRSKRIMAAQQTRGLETEGNALLRARAFLPSLGPLIIGSLTETEERAVTLETRGFSVPGRRQRARVYKFESRDQLIAVGAVLIGVIGVVMGVVL